MANKKVNVELNMTPFIGLFALLVVMLLLTAVWNRIAALSTDTTASSAADENTPPPKKQVQLNVTILPHAIEMAEDSNGTRIPNAPSGDIDVMRFVQMLQYWKKKYPKRSDIVLNTENTVTYEKLIRVFDTLVGNEWPDVGVSTQ